jgi:hypothetical protein
VVRGLLISAPDLPPTPENPATAALQAALAAQLGKRDQHLASRVGVYPIVGTTAAVVGEWLGRAPEVFPELRQLGPNTPFALRFPAATTGVDRGHEVGEDGATLEGVLRGLVDGLGLDLSPGRAGELELGRDQGVRNVLLSTDGRDGALVYGYTRWRAGPAYEGGRVRTHAFDLGNDEAMRVVGVTFAQVGGGTAAQVLDDDLDGADFEEARALARRETLALYDSATEPFGWHLVDTSPVEKPRGP